jgi:hypothetical protein
MLEFLLFASVVPLVLVVAGFVLNAIADKEGAQSKDVNRWR